LFENAEFFQIEVNGLSFLVDFVVFVCDFLVENDVIFNILPNFSLSICPYFVGSFQSVVKSFINFLNSESLTSPRVRL